MIEKSNEKYHIQCTTWKDKKQVIILHIHLLSNDGYTTVKLYIKNKRQIVNLNTPSVQSYYTKYSNAENRNDCDCANDSVSIRTNM